MRVYGRMNKPMSFALFGASGGAAILGIAASRPLAGVSPSFGDTFAGRAAWLLVAGATAVALARAISARLQPSLTTT